MGKQTERKKKSVKESNKESRNDRNSVRKKKLNRRKALMILLGIILALILIFALKNILLYLESSKVDPDEPYPVKGVDVSAYQKEIDWKGLEEEGVKFAFIKATEGTTFVDKRFEYNWKEAHRTSMKVGAYHFLTYTTEGDTQAQNFIDTVDKKWGMLPPVVDVEFYGEYLKKHPSKDEMYAILDVVIERFEEEYNRAPIIYTNRSIYKKYISGRYDDYPVWISSPDRIPEKLSDDREWLFCQYTFTGTSPSIDGGEVHVDYNVFNGSKWEFMRYKGK